MMGGVLVLTRAAELHTEIKGQLEKLSYKDVTVTDLENNALNRFINNPPSGSD